MRQQNRPLSPHLQIYRMTDFTSMMSVMHRATGIVSAMGLVLITFWLAMAATGENTLNIVNNIFKNAFIVLCLFVWTGCLAYHFCNGIRHLLWDAGKGLEIEEARRSARLVVICAIVLNIVVWIAISI